MIRTIRIASLEDAAELLLNQQRQEDIDRLRSDYLYRGMPSSAFTLTTSLRVNCGDLQERLEPSILRYFSKYSITEDPYKGESVWSTITLGQHYGLPTRFLDWSHSPLVALHFATAEANIRDMDKRDGVVWRINWKEMSACLPEDYKKVLKRDHTDVFSLETLGELAPTTKQYDADMGSESIALVEPPSTDQRIINQYSYFMNVPMGITDIEDFLDRKTQTTTKYIIAKEVRWELRDLLDQWNVSERIMYPGLDGLCAWIARHYYVK